MASVAYRLAAGAAAVLLGVASAASAAPGDSFSAPVRVDDAASVVSANAAIAVNAHGDAVAIWDHGTPGWTIFGARRPAGGSWGSPVLLTGDFGGQPDTAALTADGTAYFDAVSRDDDGDHILAWAADGTITDTGIGGHDDVGKVLADAAGDVVAYTVNPSHAITYAYALPGAPGWTSTTMIRFFGSSAVALAPKHTYYIAYVQDAGQHSTLLRVRTVDGVTGSSTLVLRRTVCPINEVTSLSAQRPYDINAGTTGAAVLVWRCTSRTAQSIKALCIDAAGHAGRSVLLARSRRSHVGTRLSPPRVAFAGARATVVFSRATGHGRRNVLATTSRGGTRWTRPSIKVANVQPSRATGIDGNLTSTPNGAALYTYRDGAALYAIRRLPGAAFGAPVRVFRSSDLHTAPPGAITSNGTATVLQLLQHTKLRARNAPN